MSQLNVQLAKQKLYFFYIQFLKEEVCSTLANIKVIVPSTFLKLQGNKIFAKYLTPPYGDEDLDLVSGLTSTGSAIPPDDWDLLRCRILKGFATYEEADEFRDQDLSQVTTNGSNELDFKVPDFDTEEVVLAPENLSRIVVLQTPPLHDDGKNSNDSVETITPSNVKNLTDSVVVDSGHFSYSQESSVLLAQSDDTELQQGQAKLLECILEKATTKFLNALKVNEQNLAQKFCAMEAKLTSLRQDVDFIKTYLTEKRPFRENEFIVDLKIITKKHGVNFPLKSHQEFLDFDLKLTGELAEAIKAYFICTINTNRDPAEMVGTIWKTLITRDVLARCTASKSSGNKTILKDTQFGKIFESAIMSAFNTDNVTMDNTMVFQIVRSVINNSKDWEDKPS